MLTVLCVLRTYSLVYFKGSYFCCEGNGVASNLKLDTGSSIFTADSKGKGKGKVHPRTGHVGPERE